jgi:prepilin-type processing-associated H-X9-DG protein
MTYLGSRLWQSGINTIDAWRKAYAETTNAAELKRPAATLMFTDTAFYQSNQFLIEYSFAEPPYFVVDGKPDTSGKKAGIPQPSIHFRHKSRANIGWADGHIEWREMAKFDGKNAYGVESASLRLGWFEPVDNTPFDLE